MIGRTHSSETIQKIKQAKVGHVVTDDTRQKISAALKGKPGTWVGKKHNNQSRKKMSEAAKKRKHSESTRALMSLQRKGKVHTSESRKKMSDAAKGKSKEKFTCSVCGRTIGGKSNIIRHESSH
jgi:rubrerythrin